MDIMKWECDVEEVLCDVGRLVFFVVFEWIKIGELECVDVKVIVIVFVKYGGVKVVVVFFVLKMD